jgi:tRNA A37 threonylcarbamoyladenosine modification protein TsaB
VILDARRGEIYAAVYDSDLNPVAVETVTKLPLWLQTLKEPEYEFITATGAPFHAALSATRFESMRCASAPRSLAAAVARCAELDSERGQLLTPVEADANYVRSSDAELFWRDK